ncbi:Type II secretion system protein E [Ensifer adhaerens]|jgi:general secretion pathway protein E|nr:Type II secretion system protein E [Ensifer adhaerens]
MLREPDLSSFIPDPVNFFDGFGTSLVDAGILDEASLVRAQRAAAKTNERLDQVLLKLGLIPETRLCSEIAAALGILVVGLDDIPIAPISAELIDAGFVRSRRVLPLQVDEESIVLAEVDPFDGEPREALSYLTGLPIRTRLIEATLFQRAVQSLYDETSQPHEQNADPRFDGVSEDDVERLRDIAGEAPVIRLVNEIIAEAVDARASDIHIEPMQDGLDVRYRIDGHLHRMRTLAHGLQAAVSSRIKIMARLDIAERRMPQDGRIKAPVRGVDIDLRVSTIPTAFGESIVLRILDRSRVELNFSTLGFSKGEIADLSRLTGQPNGIFLVTGPTGSGKTTTLYTALASINRPSAKIFTVEDPIEYQLAGINQVQVQPSIGLDFPHALRSILRQDPDVIMIGEIRDLETAKIAIQASLTGHLVLSTLHTNSAAATVTRLIDMGLEHFLLASTLNGVLAQRLVRRLCPHCSEPHADALLWAERITHDLGRKLPSSLPRVMSAKGCPSCRNTGFSGRLAIAELMTIGERQRAQILAHSSEVDLEASARADGMNALYESGLSKVWSGMTTIEDVLSITKVAP